MKHFCFWFKTRTGCLIAAYVTGVISAFGCVGSILRLLLGLPVVMQNDDFQGQFPFNPLFYIFAATYFAVHTVASFAAIPAVKQNFRMCMIPIIVILIIDTVLSGVGVIILAVKSTKKSYFQKYFIGGTLTGMLWSIMSVYFLLVVGSHYLHLYHTQEKVPLEPLTENKKISCLRSGNLSDASINSLGPTDV